MDLHRAHRAFTDWVWWFVVWLERARDDVGVVGAVSVGVVGIALGIRLGVVSVGAIGVGVIGVGVSLGLGRGVIVGDSDHDGDNNEPDDSDGDNNEPDDGDGNNNNKPNDGDDNDEGDIGRTVDALVARATKPSNAADAAFVRGLLTEAAWMSAAAVDIARAKAILGVPVANKMKPAREESCMNGGLLLTPGEEPRNVFLVFAEDGGVVVLDLDNAEDDWAYAPFA